MIIDSQHGSSCGIMSFAVVPPYRDAAIRHFMNGPQGMGFATGGRGSACIGHELTVPSDNTWQNRGPNEI